MKLHVGSIQRRGGNLYLVTRVAGKSRWVSLKTGDAETAKRRARRLLPPEDGEWAWLAHLVNIGEIARNKMRRMAAAARLTWRNLWDEFMCRAAGTISEASEWSYERWMRILAEAAEALGLSPEDILKKESCAKIIARLMGHYISAKRMLIFYRRVWRTLGLDCGLWDIAGVDANIRPPREREFYRRLSLDEIRKVRARLMETHPELADMVLIGYSTGLRLSDVAELELAEIEEGDRFLRIIPNKTRIRKPHPIRIPLTEQARKTIQRLKTADGGGDKDGHLFPPAARKRPSRRIAAAFRSCGVSAHGNGRASFHSLRATFISMMDEAGIPPHITDAITGHADGGMHARYTQPSSKVLLAAVARAIPTL